MNAGRVKAKWISWRPKLQKDAARLKPIFFNSAQREITRLTYYPLAIWSLIYELPVQVAVHFVYRHSEAQRTPVDAFCRNSDYGIRKAVTQNLLLPLPGYGLKNICKHPDLVNFQWENDESGSQWSVVQYFEFLNTDNDEKKQALKDDILTYNRDEVRATRALEECLRRL